MSVESFIQAMPKVELHIQLEGAFNKETVLLLAEQNDMQDSIKRFQTWVDYLDEPDYERLDEIVDMIGSWVKYPEDLARLVYDLGVSLSKQNVRYAEIVVDPTIYTDNGMTFDEFMNAITDGRDRAERGWNIRMAWILSIPRAKPRKGDDVARWATSITARKGDVVALGLIGADDKQPVGQFKRAFSTAAKKEQSRVAHAGNMTGLEGVTGAMDTLKVDRLYDTWNVAEDEQLLTLFAESGIPLGITPAREVCLGRIESYADYPLRRLYDEDVKFFIGAGMPALYKTSLNEEYVAAVEQGGLNIDELQEVALNTVRYSFLPEEDKAAMLEDFTALYAELRQEHLAVNPADHD